MSHETNVLALDEGLLNEERNFNYLPLEMLVKSSYSLGASFNEIKHDQEVLLIEGTLRVSF